MTLNDELEMMAAEDAVNGTPNRRLMHDVRYKISYLNMVTKIRRHLVRQNYLSHVGLQQQDNHIHY
ncbi:hypothetical protein UA38_11850 [Photobacterium kishitanii]|uniref:Integrase n=1 Tax=Photobacterium kishitanii TaxID=318456 RepID=A0AAX0YRA0_9GAMM|nr:hypothetical protein [Photobacterium kishitanii]KJG57062.1 hypothetical protein UA38_11850 [Photobacterium kishitanii]KJG60588.1 hypothetical protein UA42_14645 [Photobacterium kishitanii]KJG64889.1 hypothetical protein UA40_14335 [Photobacterium kishitanii]KJG68525.1 hypothetical protein UA41_16745 [Photobacterium kishitanii]OBU31190.1 hypothetical protein AYY23_19965 [Photobacterium kishitanii]